MIDCVLFGDSFRTFNRYHRGTVISALLSTHEIWDNHGRNNHDNAQHNEHFQQREAGSTAMVEIPFASAVCQNR
jgi:hypothetical protein